MRRTLAFTLIELLAVIAIMAILFVVALPALKVIQGTALSAGARQVANAMQLARQFAINRRAPVRFIIAVHTNNIPTELVCRAYTICVSNGDGTWTALQDWQLLPDGVVFNNLDISSYSPSTINEIPLLGNSGARFLGGGFAQSNAWQYFDSIDTNTVFFGGSSRTCITSLVEFQSIGIATGPGGRGLAGGALGGIRLAQGTVLNPSDRTLLIADTNNWVYIEYDQYGGRVRVRYRDDFR